MFAQTHKPGDDKTVLRHGRLFVTIYSRRITCFFSVEDEFAYNLHNLRKIYFFRKTGVVYAVCAWIYPVQLIRTMSTGIPAYFPHLANQMMCRAPFDPCARTRTSSTSKPTFRSRCINSCATPADHTANTPPGRKASYAAVNPFML